jgi:hypothetical protein
LFSLAATQDVGNARHIALAGRGVGVKGCSFHLDRVRANASRNRFSAMNTDLSW